MSEADTRVQTTRIAAYGLVVDGGRILLCRISAMLPGDRGKWTLPGGRLEFGEGPRDAVVREVLEETGLHVRPVELVDVDSEVFFFDDSTMHALRIIYRVEVLGGDLANEADGSTDLCAWHTLEEALLLPLVGLARHGIELAFASS